MSKTNKKRQIIQVALRPEDADFLKEIANELDISASTFVRTVLISDFNKRRESIKNNSKS